jgi:SAM-dependent methyltransferase
VAGRGESIVAGVLPRFWEAAGLPPEAVGSARFASRRFVSVIDFFGPSERWDGQRILDFGGGNGSLSVACREAFGGRHAVADRLPWSPKLVAAQAAFGVEERYSIDIAERATLEALPRDFDLILCVEVLEHLLVNPLLLFRELYDHLKPGGRFFVTTPNQARASNRVKLLVGRSIKEKERFPTDGVSANGHVMEYTGSELDELLAAESFELVRGTVVQNLPGPRVRGVRRLGARLLDTALARRLALGDDLLRLYRTVPRPPPGTPRPIRI